jgi:hypothetical protein
MITDYYKNLLLTKLNNDIDNIALSTKYDSITNTDNITTDNILYINTATNTIISDSIKSTLELNVNNCNVNVTTITGGITSNSCNVSSTTGFNVGDKILLNSVYYKITNISGNTITIDGTFRTTPSNNDTITQIITRVHLVRNNNESLFIEPIDLVKKNNIITVNSIIDLKNLRLELEIDENTINEVPDPQAPTNLTYNLVGNILTISWNNMNVETYEYELIGSVIGKNPNNSLTLNITDPFYNINPNNVYTFKVRSINRNKVSSYSILNNIILTFEDRLIYNSNKSGQWQSYSIKPDGTGEINITNDNTKEDHYCTYSPVLQSYIFCRKVGGILQIHKKHVITQVVTQLTNDTNDLKYPNVSPDGLYICASSSGNLKIFDSSTGNLLQNWQPSLPMHPNHGTSAFDNSNNILLWGSIYPNYTIEKRTFNGNLIQILDNNLGSKYPKYNSNKTKIIYSSTVGSFDQVFTMNTDGTNKVQITTSTGDKEFPAFSPDELSFVFIQPAYDGNLYISTFSSPNTKTNITNNSAQNEFNGFWGYI